MKPIKGQSVKCFLQSSIILEGIVEEWSDEQVILKSIGEKNLIIIHRPNVDIMVTTVLLVPSEPVKELPEIKKQILNKLKETLESSEDDVKDKNLKQLRKLVIEQEKKIISDKQKEHTSSSQAGTSYTDQSKLFLKGNTNGSQIESPKYDTREKT